MRNAKGVRGERYKKRHRISLGQVPPPSEVLRPVAPKSLPSPVGQSTARAKKRKAVRPPTTTTRCPSARRLPHSTFPSPRGGGVLAASQNVAIYFTSSTGGAAGLPSESLSRLSTPFEQTPARKGGSELVGRGLGMSRTEGRCRFPREKDESGREVARVFALRATHQDAGISSFETDP